MRVARPVLLAVAVVTSLVGVAGPARADTAGSGTRSYQAGLLAAGVTHTCAVAADHTVLCWGSDDHDELGSPGAEDQVDPVRVPGITTAVAVGAGAAFSCALLGNGTVTCWGWNLDGELGTTADGNVDGAHAPATVPGVATAVALSVGVEGACVVLSDHTVKCWGSNAYGQTGSPNATDSSPHLVAGVTTAVSVTTSGTHACALLADRTLRCWGDNSDGQLGSQTNIYTLTPNPMPVTAVGVSGVQAVSASGSFTCAVLADSTVRCWGYNDQGQLGLPDTTLATATPTEVPGVTGVVALGAEEQHVCAVLRDGTATCWGHSYSGSMGPGVDGIRGPRAVPGLAGAVAVSAGRGDTCALIVDGTVSCLGVNRESQLGRTANAGTNNANPDPETVPLPPLVGAVSTLSLTAAPITPVTTGHAFVLRLTLHNAGPDVAVPSVWIHHETGVPVVTPLPAGLVAGAGPVDTWFPGTVASGADAVLTLPLRADLPGAHSITAEVASSTALDLASTAGDNRPGEADQVTVPVAVQATPDGFGLTVTHAKRAITAKATLLLLGVAPSSACTGPVAFTIKHGRTTTTRKSSLSLSRSGTCSASLHYSASKPGSYAIGATHAATTVVAASTAPRRSVAVS